MSGSQFAPDALGICDAGDAPVVFIDGVASHVRVDGIVRVALYSSQPVIEPGADPTDPCRFIKLVVMKLIYTAETERVMRRQLISRLEEDVKPSDLLIGAHH